jgi:hypothetical protein
MALAEIDRVIAAGVRFGCVLADAGMGWARRSTTGLGDVPGTHLYDYYGGFPACVIAITVVYALILPTLLLVPKSLIATADG